MSWFLGKDGSFRGMVVKPGGDPNNNFKAFIALIILVVGIVLIDKVYEYFFVEKSIEQIIEPSEIKGDQ